MASPASRWMSSVAAKDLAMRALQEHSEPVPFSGCWLWNGATNGKGKYGRGGYGVLTFLGKRHYAHRLSYETHFGAIPNGMMVCHRCDVRCCVNPDHLYIGTAMDNHRDKIERNKQRNPGAKGDRNGIRKNPWLVRGENNGNSKLSFREVQIIKDLFKNGEKQKDIAKTFNLGPSQVSRICRGEHWK